MIRLLRENAESLELAAFAASFLGIALWETFWPRQLAVTKLGRRWTNNIALFCLNGGLAFLLMPVERIEALRVAPDAAAAAWRWVHESPTAELALGFAIFDLCAYWLHRLAHMVPLLWRFHRVHHSDIDVDVTTSYRHHPLEVAYVNTCLIAPLILFEIPWYVLASYSVVASAVSALQHGNIRLAPALEARVERLLVLPEMHRLHHSVQATHQGSNYSSVFTAWDRIFGTYRRRQTDRTDLVFGLSERSDAGSEERFVSIMATPLRAA